MNQQMGGFMPESPAAGQSPAAGGPHEERVVFTGTLGGFARLQLVNLLLTLVTLGIYRFWAKARTRRYLWANTRLYDEPFEYTGTGMELFLGFLITAVAFVPLVLVFAFATVLGPVGYALILLTYGALLYLFGVATFRTLRYQLSRTTWRGIRGGSDDRGWSYGLSFLGHVLLTIVTLGLYSPWATTRLWNRRYSAMSFGTFPFAADAPGLPLFKRFLVVLGVGMAIAAAYGIALWPALRPGAEGAATDPADLVAAVGAILGLYVVLGFAALWYWSHYYRHVLSHTTLGPLRLQFDANTRAWFMLFLTNMLIIVFTLGLGAIFITPFRSYRFAMNHAAMLGDPHIDQMLQSPTRPVGQGEGLAEAFDMGAI